MTATATLFPPRGEASPGWDTPARLVEARDRNADPSIVEVDLDALLADVEIAPGTHVKAWTYNGSLPGPLIRARVGDRVIVHFSNHLPQPTTVHWHGLRIPIEMDGVPDVSQPAVAPGQSFTYDFVVRDPGLFWYHPHVMSAAQVGFGLYGAFLVEDPAEAAENLEEVLMVLSDIEITERGDLENPESGGTTGMAFGREGSHILVNGREAPTLHARPGVPQRWRVVNAAKTRYFEVASDGLRFRTIGTDGGLQEAPVDADSLILAPGERVDAIVIPQPQAENRREIAWWLRNRGYGSVEYRQPTGTLFTMSFDEVTPEVVPKVPDLRRAVAPLSLDGVKDVEIRLTLAQRPSGEFEYGIGGVPFQKDRPLYARPGETQIWTVVNTTDWSHPFHLHGFFFQVLDEHGQPVTPHAWKDTVDVPFKKTVRLAVRFDEDRPGAWMFHCHVLDHADGGLMGTVIVGSPSRSTPHSHGSSAR